MPRRILLAALLLSLLLSPGLFADQPVLSARDLESSFGVDWYGLYLQGKKIGYLRTSRGRDDASGDVTETMLMKMKLTSFGQRVEIDFEQQIRFEGKPPYRMLRGDHLMKDTNSKKTTTLIRRGDKFEVAANIAGAKSNKVIDALDYTLLDAMAAELWIRTAPKEGAKITYKDLDIEEVKIDESTSTMMAEKTSLVNGVEVKFFEVKSRSTRNPVDMLARHDDKGKLLSGNFAIFEVRSEPEEQAKNTQYSQDLFVLGMVKIDRKLGHPHGVKSLVIEVTGEEAKMLPSGPRQSITQKSPDVHILKMGRAHGTPAKATADEIKENLQATNEYPLDNPRVKELAREAIGDAGTDEEKVKRLVAFVYKYVRPSLSATLPNIPDLLERKRGDCKSYALLFNTLARAAGVPAREVSGLLYVGDDTRAFGGHAWNEVVLNGEWVPVDASMGETEVNATHICFGDDTRSTANLLGTMGKLRFRVLEVERGE